MTEEEALDALEQAKAARAAASEQYRKAVMECKKLGITNVRMAKSLGVTETAIRNYVQRKIQETRSTKFKQLNL